LEEGLVHKSSNPYALLLPKIGIIRHQIPKISDVMNLLSVATLFCKITHSPNIFMIRVHRDSLGMFVLICGFNTNLGALWDTLGLSYFLVGIINMKIQKKVHFIALLSLIFK